MECETNDMNVTGSNDGNVNGPSLETSDIYGLENLEDEENPELKTRMKVLEENMDHQFHEERVSDECLEDQGCSSTSDEERNQEHTDLDSETNLGTSLEEINEMVGHSVGDIDPYVGMEFESVEAAETFYKAYAMRLGFGVRVGTSRRSKRSGEITAQRFVCNKQGFRAKKYLSSKRPRPATREGCNAMINLIRRDSGKWVVSIFVSDHNHELLAPIPFHRPRRRVSNTTRNLIHTLDKARIRPARMVSASSAQSTEGATNEEVYNVSVRALQKALQEILAVKKKVEGVTQLGSPVSGVQEAETCHGSQPSNTIEKGGPCGNPQQTPTTYILYDQTTGLSVMPVFFSTAPAAQAPNQPQQAIYPANPALIKVNPSPTQAQVKPSSIRAAALAAGARIAPAETAASLLRAARSKNVIHVGPSLLDKIIADINGPKKKPSGTGNADAGPSRTESNGGSSNGFGDSLGGAEKGEDMKLELAKEPDPSVTESSATDENPGNVERESVEDQSHSVVGSSGTKDNSGNVEREMGREENQPIIKGNVEREMGREENQAIMVCLGAEENPGNVERELANEQNQLLIDSFE
ncbi:hypothetical protein AMTR_s00016p00255820 [Amborella trichopoda]|uniref:FAR1 domain-containing protein n=1 Tax=Amborella trichopoda TaxID=13333 RepID=W1P954_AMBTC|nr:hypothetical protein AMTR_s00016p00255820 [Amborella trichopoda]